MNDVLKGKTIGINPNENLDLSEPVIRSNLIILEVSEV
jgi:hypothetical protein